MMYSSSMKAIQTTDANIHMIIRFTFLVSLLASALSSINAQAESYSMLHAGQEWSYRSRSQDTLSTVVIGQLENHPDLGRIVHCLVRNVYLSDSEAVGGASLNQLSHIPISEAAFRDSLIEKIAEGIDWSEMNEGVRTWREASGGVFSVSLKEVVQIVDETIADPDTTESE